MPPRIPLAADDDTGQSRAHHIGHKAGIDQEQSGYDQRGALPQARGGQEIPVQAAGEQENAEARVTKAWMMLGHDPIISKAGS